MMPTFTVIDNATGKEVDKSSSKIINEYGWEISLRDSTFILTEDGQLRVFDMWQDIYDCPPDRFSVVFNEEGSVIWNGDVIWEKTKSQFKHHKMNYSVEIIDRTGPKRVVYECHNLKSWQSAYDKAKDAMGALDITLKEFSIIIQATDKGVIK